MNYRLEATYYRTALLLGLIQGDEVHHWAERVLEKEATPGIEFVELVSIPTTDLSALRHGLWPLSIEPEPAEVHRAMYGHLYADLLAGRRSIEDTVTILRQMRSMSKMPPPLYAALNDALIAYGFTKPSGNALRTFLEPHASAHKSFRADNR